VITAAATRIPRSGTWFANPTCASIHRAVSSAPTCSTRWEKRVGEVLVRAAAEVPELVEQLGSVLRNEYVLTYSHAARERRKYRHVRVELTPAATG
jgi:hypothetical protein